MIYRKVQAPIDVMMCFRDSHPEPMVFKWNGRFHQVKRVLFMHAERVGQKRVYFFSVSDGSQAFRLRFCTESLLWSLEEVCRMERPSTPIVPQLAFA